MAVDPEVCRSKVELGSGVHPERGIHSVCLIEDSQNLGIVVACVILDLKLVREFCVALSTV